MADIKTEIEQNGFAILPALLNSKEIDSLSHALSTVNGDAAVRERVGVYAIRNLLDVVPAVRSLAGLPKVTEAVCSILGTSASPVRAALFDKTAGANWLVPWHQDLTICVKRKVNVEGFGPWTCKASVPHVQPPSHILGAMLAVRLHLDGRVNRRRWSVHSVAAAHS